MKEEILEALSKPYVHTIKDINKATGIKRIDVEDILTVLKKMVMFINLIIVII